MDDATQKPPRGAHIGYWRSPHKAARNAVQHAPLDPLSGRQIVALVAVGVLILSLVVMSAGWWVQAVHR